MRFFILACAFVLSGAAFSQQDIVGEWEHIGRMCMDDKKLIPIENSVQEINFKANGRLTGSYTELPGASDEMTYKEYIDHKWDNMEKRFKSEVKALREACKTGAVDDDLAKLCNNQVAHNEKRRRDMIAEIQKEIDDDRREFMEESGGLTPEEVENRICVFNYTGSWRVSEENLSISVALKDSNCGNEGQRGSFSGWYYFDEGRLYHVLPAFKDSRKECGNSEWAAIYSRK